MSTIISATIFGPGAKYHSRTNSKISEDYRGSFEQFVDICVRDSGAMACHREELTESKSDLAGFTSGVLGAEGHAARRAVNCMHAQLLAYDFDKGQISIEQVREKLSGYEYWIYESASSTPALVKFRAVIPLDRHIEDRQEFKQVYHCVAAAFGFRDFMDPSVGHNVAILYFGTEPKMRRSIYSEGRPLPLDEVDRSLVELKKRQEVKVDVEGDTARDFVRLALDKDPTDYYTDCVSVITDYLRRKIPEFIDTPESQDEPDWFWSTVISASLARNFSADEEFVQAAVDVFHHYSSRYSGYNEAEAEEKFRRCMEYNYDSQMLDLKDFPEDDELCFDLLLNRRIFKSRYDWTPPKADLTLDEMRLESERLFFENFKHERFIICNSQPGVGKTYNCIKAIIRIRQKMAFYSADYGALWNAKQILLAQGVPESEIAFIPQPAPPPDEKDTPTYPYQFECTHPEKVMSMRNAGLEPRLRVCKDCKDLLWCPLILARENTESKSYILAHASYLRGTSCVAWNRDRHVVLDEYMVEELLGKGSFTEAEIDMFRRSIRRFQYISCRKRKDWAEACEKIWDQLLGIKIRTDKLRASESSTGDIFDVDVCEPAIDDWLYAFHKHVEKNYRDSVSLIRKMRGVTEVLLTKMNKTTTDGDRVLSFDLTYRNPIDLSNARSITVLDATANVDLMKKTMKSCNVTMEPTDFGFIHPDMANVIQVFGESPSRKGLKTSLFTRMVNRLNKFIRERGLKNVAMITYMKSEMGQAVNEVTVLPKVHFGGQIVGHNLIKDGGFNALFVIGAPRQNGDAVRVLAYLIGVYKKGDDLPEFGTNYWMNHNEKKVKFWSYDDPEWMKIDHYLIARELLQSMGRGACRGIPTLIVANIALDGYPIQSRTWTNLIGNVRVSSQTAEERIYEVFEPDMSDDEIYELSGIARSSYSQRIIGKIRASC